MRRILWELLHGHHHRRAGLNLKSFPRLNQRDPVRGPAGLLCRMYSLRRAKEIKQRICLRILYRERQRAEKQLFFRFLPARRMGEAGKGQRFPKGNFYKP